MECTGPTEAYSEFLNRVGEVSKRLAGGLKEETSELCEDIVKKYGPKKTEILTPSIRDTFPLHSESIEIPEQKTF